MNNNKREWPSVKIAQAKKDYYDALANHEKGDITPEELERVRRTLKELSIKRQTQLRHRTMRYRGLPD